MFMNVVNAIGNRLFDERPDGVNVFRRKSLRVLESDTLPLVVVAPGSDGETIVFETFPAPASTGGVVYAYPVAVAVVTRGNNTDYPPINGSTEVISEAGVELENHLSVREWVRDQLFQPYIDDVASVLNCEVTPGPVVETSGAGGSLYDVSVTTAVYWSDETRES